MKKNRFKIALFSILIFFFVLSSLVLIPRSYDVLKFEERVGTQYWDLSTGSRIGYTLIKASSNPSATPIIYIHGGPGGMIVDEIVEVLKPLSEIGFNVYFYDQIGSGHSDRLENIKAYSPQRHQEDLTAIINELGTAKVILIGHSWGAMLSMMYLSDHPDKVAKIIFTGPGPILPIRNELSKIETPDSLDLHPPKFSNKEANEKAYNFRSKAVLYYATHFDEKLATDKEADVFFTSLNDELKKSTFKDQSKVEKSEGGGGYYAHVMTVKHFNEVSDKRSQINKIKVPALIMRGEYDNQKWGYAAEYLTLLSNSKLEIIENAGHSVLREKPKVCIDIIKDFLEK